MLIVKFILLLFLLEIMVKNSDSVFNIFDYVCGVGYFLNEYVV